LNATGTFLEKYIITVPEKLNKNRMRMKRILPFVILLFTGLQTLRSQGLSLNQLFTAASLPVSKCNHFIVQKGFSSAMVEKLEAVTTHSFEYKSRKKDTIRRNVIRFEGAGSVLLEYNTASKEEFDELRKDLAKDKFYLSEKSNLQTGPWVYQKKDVIVHASPCSADKEFYCLRVEKSILPQAKDVLFGEDLLSFNSHEQLAYIFGRGNVIKDLYYFSATEFSRCSVLFPHTDRQAVFIWNDEINDYGLSYLVLGGQVMLESNRNSDQMIPENSWVLKSNIKAGMNLRELRKINGKDFSFHSISSKFSGMVLPENTGNIDFKKEGIVLACMNCSDLGASASPIITADEAIAQDRRFFVFTILLYPPASLASIKK
jgi:hypothetical protein